ncbi:MAG TPA: hypothetical protein VMM59_09430 [Thermohalobaculum sp.]|nr:hypothetical protein [Thermohalobaculum sp.]
MSGAAPKVGRAGRVVAVVLGAAVLVFVLANAHLVYVATSTQPDCVAEGAGGYRAAKPAC